MCRGKAPPVEFFDGESDSTPFEDWMPSFERTARWNHCSDEGCLVQLAGHLRKRVLREWNLLTTEDTEMFAAATEALLNRLDPHCRVLAAQEFRHAIQREEPVPDYIRRLEQIWTG